MKNGNKIIISQLAVEIVYIAVDSTDNILIAATDNDAL